MTAPGAARRIGNRSSPTSWRSWTRRPRTLRCASTARRLMISAPPFRRRPAPHAVGTVSRMLTDASRTNRFNIRTNSSFMVTVWYPAQTQTGPRPAPYLDRPLAERSAYWSATYASRVPAIVEFAAADALVAADPGRFPVVFYAHGLGHQMDRGVRAENSERLEELGELGPQLEVGLSAQQGGVAWGQTLTVDI